MFRLIRMKQFSHMILRCCVALLVMGFSLAKTRGADDPGAALKVTASFAAKRPIAGSSSFWVVLHVENVSGRPLLIQAMCCSWPDAWKSDEPHVLSGGWNCGKNFLQTIEIAPGAWFTDEMEISIDHTVKRTVSFRMGFDPGNGGKKSWSNALEAKIDPTAKPAPGPAGWNGIGRRTWGPGCKIVPTM